MKWLLIVWGLGGPEVGAVLSNRAICEAVANHESVTQAVKFCVPLQLDNVATDVVIYPHPEHLGERR